MFSKIPRWRAPLGFSLLLAAAGIWLAAPALLVAAIAPLVFVIYGGLTRSATLDDGLTIRRAITPQRTYPGDSTVIELTVENQTDEVLKDFRLVDGVPEELAVIDGSPRAALTLAADEAATVTYTLRARYGEFEFEPVTCQTRNLSATTAETTTITASGDTQLTATLEPEEFPLPQRTSGLAGELAADRGGEGLEFHSIRAYQPEDPVSRINWRQYARERELSTIDYRQQEAAEILVVVDARATSDVAAAETAPTGTELSVYVAVEAIEGLLETRNRVGLIALGVDGLGDDRAAVEPGIARHVRVRMQQLLDQAAATARPGADRASDDEPTPEWEPLEIVQQLDPDTQLLVITPLVDEYPMELVRQAHSTRHTVSVYSPMVTDRPTVGGTISTVQRDLRLLELRHMGTTVVDWQPEDPLTVALERTTPQRTEL